MQSKQPIKRIIFNYKPFCEMIKVFASNFPNESIVWLTGTVKNGVGTVKKAWVCELEYSSPSSAQTKASWLIQFIKKLRSNHPNHNLIILAHRHPIGSSLSCMDKETLKALADWNTRIYWAIIACDIQLACYESDKIHSVEWRLRSESKKTNG